MRIALVSPEYVTEFSRDGGLAGYVHRTARALQDLGHCPLVLVASDRDERLMHDGVDVLRVRSDCRFMRYLDRLTLHKLPLDWLWQSWALNRALIKLERDQPFDVIHYSSYKAVAFFHRGTTPAVIRISSVQRVMHEAAEARRGLRLRGYEWLEMRALRRVAVLFAPSRLVADGVSGMTGLTVQVIESPWMPESTEPDAAVYREHLKGRNYLLYFGTVSVLKGVTTLAEAISGVLADRPDLYLVIAGKQQRYQGLPLVDHVRRCAGAHADRIIYLGRLDRASLLPVVANAQGVVLPSRVDNLSNACIEAMGQERVVIGTRGASFEQLIDDGANGLLCSIDDASDLQHAIRRLLSLSPEQRQAMGQQARERVSRLRPATVVAQLLALYETAIGCHAEGLR